MNHLTGRLNNPYYFGSGGYNSEQFNDFFEDFKKSFTYQLKRVNATEIEFSKGHFYLTGFFKVDEQYFYFSLSDVRYGLHQTDWRGNITLLMRTAKHNKDFTGGANNYVAIENGMYKNIARKFNLTVKENYKGKRKSTEELVDIIMEKGYLIRTFPSIKQASSVAFELHRRLNTTNQTVTYSKYGRGITKAYVNRPEFTFHVDGWTRRAEFRLGTLTDEQLIDSLILPTGKCYKRNPFSGEGCELTPLAAALYDKIKEWELSGNSDLFHQALMIFRSKWGEEYYTLLD